MQIRAKIAKRLFILLGIFWVSFINAKAVNFPLKKSKYNTFQIKVKIGTNKYFDSLTLCLSENGIITYQSASYRSEFSKTSKIRFETNEFKSVLDSMKFDNDLELEDQIITQVHQTKNKEGLFGINKGDKEDGDQLFIQNLFKAVGGKNIFYINLSTNTFSVGDYPEKYYKLYSNNTKLFKYCELELEAKNYKCKFDSIYFKYYNGEYFRYSEGGTFSFDVRPNAIYAPKKFMDQIERTYFKELIAKKMCTVEMTNFKYIYCEKEFDYMEDPTVHNITIVFGKYSIKLTKKELFLEFEDKVFFLIVYNSEDPGWTLGFPFFKKFTTIFDLKDNIVGFINND